MYKNVMIRLSEEDHKRLSDAAYAARISMAEFVRQGIDLRMASAEGSQKPTRAAISRALKLLVYTTEQQLAGWQLVPPEGTAEEPEPDRPFDEVLAPLSEAEGAEDLCFLV